jgi:coenzyme F420-reducing hydrogenase beta subunit
VEGVGAVVEVVVEVKDVDEGKLVLKTKEGSWKEMRVGEGGRHCCCEGCLSDCIWW